MDKITLFRTFTSVVETGSFSKTAALIGLTQSQVSKMIKKLEVEFETSLFHRTTRKITLTEEGQKLLAHAKSICDRFDAAKDDIKGYQSEPKGQIRVLTSDGTGRTVFLDVLNSFLKKYPFISINHILSDKFIPLAENQIDVAIWLGELKDSSYRAKRIGTARRITVASKEYLIKRGAPTHPKELYNHDCIVFDLLSDYTALGNKIVWRFESTRLKEHFDIEVKGRYRTNNSSLVKQAVLKGLGIYQGPSYLFSKEIKNGELVEILEDFCFEPFPINVLFSAQEFLPKRVRTFIDFFTDEFDLIPTLSVSMQP